jgi:hypothetical protein
MVTAVDIASLYLQQYKSLIKRIPKYRQTKYSFKEHALPSLKTRPVNTRNVTHLQRFICLHNIR